VTKAQSDHLKKGFLEAFRRTGNVSLACAATGLTRRRTVYEWQERDDEFAGLYRQAEIEATELLEAEAHRRAVFGVQKTKGVYFQGTLIDTFTEQEYSDTLLIFLLKARAPEKYRERYDVTSGGETLIKAYVGVELERV